MTRRAPLWLAPLLLAVAACQPVCGLRAAIVSPDPLPADAILRIEVEQNETQDGLRVQRPARQEITRTANGFALEVAWFEPSVEAKVTVWVDADDNGERDPGELSAVIEPTVLGGGGCDGLTDLGQIHLVR